MTTPETDLPEEWRGLPGRELVEPGLADLAAGRESVHSLLVAIGEPRLRWLGIPIPDLPLASDPERRLFDLLQREDPRTAHSRYNALVRRLVSFERCLEHQVFRDRRQAREGHPRPTVR